MKAILFFTAQLPLNPVSKLTKSSRRFSHSSANTAIIATVTSGARTNGMRKHALTAAVFLVFAGSGAAIADDDCHLPMDQWQPREAVQKMAEARGWTVRRIRADDGCYQIKGADENGRNIKVKVDPGSLEVVKLKREGQDDDDDENGAGQPRAAPAGMVAPPSNGLFTNKGVPKAEVK